jgi:hypothetical protein
MNVFFEKIEGKSITGSNYCNCLNYAWISKKLDYVYVESINLHYFIIVCEFSLNVFWENTLRSMQNSIH